MSRTLERLSEQVAPAVVQIHVLTYGTLEGLESETSLLSPQRGFASGVIVDRDGYIVTNAHVVQHAYRLQVELSPAAPRGPDRSILAPRPRLVGAQVVAIDEETDLAVIKVAEQGLPAVAFGDSDQVRPGQIVLAFGSPLGLTSSVTLGVVSAVGRQLEPDDPMVYIQTDASINPGNSGGPLVDADGRLVGINTLILSQSGGNEGLGFAAPSNIVRNVFEQIRKFGRVRRGEIGVHAQSVTPLLAAGLGLARDRGAILGDVYPGGPAAKAGLRVGDVIVALDGKPMENGRQLQVNLYSRTVGESVRLDAVRGDAAFTAQVEIVERDDDPGRFASLATAEQHLVQRLGILGLTIDESLARLLPDLREPTGVIVAAASGDRPPGSDGPLMAGDVIHAVNRAPVRSLQALRAAVEALKPGEPAVLQIERDGELQFVVFRME
jgi:serine protease Do